MKDKKYTPGPWRVQSPAGLRSVQVVSATMHICQVNAHAHTDAEAIANANLIAAAPDLYNLYLLAEALYESLCEASEEPFFNIGKAAEGVQPIASSLMVIREKLDDNWIAMHKGEV